MARSADDPLARLRPDLEGVAKKIADDLWGPHGPAWGTTLTELEDLALEARAILSQRVLELGLQRQAATPAPQRPAQPDRCPDCQRPFSAAPQPAPRTMETRAGEASWQEPQAYCTRCRRAFFPSEPEPGN